MININEYLTPPIAIGAGGRCSDSYRNEPSRAHQGRSLIGLFCSMPYCYILHSARLDRYYTGATEETLEIRISKHNHQSYGKNHFTAKSDDWQLFHYVQCESMLQALRLERHIDSSDTGY